jgi:hypothetical protein
MAATSFVKQIVVGVVVAVASAIILRWVSGSSRVKTYGSVERAIFQPLVDWRFY